VNHQRRFLRRLEFMVGAQTILIVDNQVMLADCLARALRGQGFNVSTAYDGARGYASYLEYPAEWIITDIEMPQLDGLTMVRAIRRINDSARVVYMSGAAENYRVELEQEARKFNARVLHKPFSLYQLLDLLSVRPVQRDRSPAVKSTQKSAATLLSGGRESAAQALKAN
jgi:DNA-binding response OmpR family regulator